jgi:O-antigen ligase
MMLQEHPMGVGANHFALVLHTQGYFHKAKLEYHKGSRGIFVHNLYRLTAAECGYLGLAALLALLARVLSFAFWHGWRTRQDVRADVLVGFSVSFLVFCFHGLIEWVHVTASIQYLFWVSAGVVAGLAHQLKHRADSSS